MRSQGAVRIRSLAFVVVVAGSGYGVTLPQCLTNKDRGVDAICHASTARRAICVNGVGRGGMCPGGAGCRSGQCTNNRCACSPTDGLTNDDCSSGTCLNGGPDGYDPHCASVDAGP